MYFQYRCINAWAPLAWLAKCPKESGRIEVWHGNQIEVRPEWFCEAVWPGPFKSGDFDQTDLVAGTGGRIRDGRAIFVSSGNTIDRIVSFETAGELFVSNSLPCLLAISGACIDTSYPRYYEDFRTIIHGLNKYKSTLKTLNGDIHLSVFGYVCWDGHKSSSAFKSAVQRNFNAFELYFNFLRQSLADLACNMGDQARQHNYRFLATASSGYDSPAIATLAREAGCEEAICIDQDRFGAVENGGKIASQIGLSPISISRDAWREPGGQEILFLAADGTAEAVPLASARRQLAGRVLLTGYHGDKMWAKDTKDVSENIVRGDSSGLSLSEYRLWVGFIHCPITFWGVRQIGDLKRLSNSEEMRPWDVQGDYSRPIPRRIVESAGVPRDAFGTSKRATAISSGEFLSLPTLTAYRAWVADNRIEWVKKGRLPPPLSDNYERIAGQILDVAVSATLKTPVLWRLAPDNSLDRPSRLRRHVFAWAAREVSQRYLRSVR